MEAADLVQGYSYWTFSDIFEENYFSSVPFHGGFGLLNIHGIAKPSYRAYQLLHRLGTEQLPVEGNHATVDVWVVRGDEEVTVLAVNSSLPHHPVADEQVQVRLIHTEPPAAVEISRIDAENANAKNVWLAMGKPDYLSVEQLQQLHGASELKPNALLWKPKSGFLRWRWKGYCEALILYVLGQGSPSYPLPKEAYHAWLSSYTWKGAYGLEMVYGGPLFMHQLSHIWIDFRGIRDAFMRDKKIDCFENSRRATLLQQRYAIDNHLRYPYYGAQGWGITACNGPGPKMLKIDGIERRFFGYTARGVPFGPDDGTLAPWAVVASLPFAPEIVLPTMRFYIDEMELKERNGEGFKATFNPLFPNPENKKAGWVGLHPGNTASTKALSS